VRVVRGASRRRYATEHFKMKKLFKLILVFIFEKTGIDGIRFFKKIRSTGDFIGTISRVEQVKLLEIYRRQSADNQGEKLNFENISFRNFSQNGEDGIILYIFAAIGFTNRKVIEIGCGNGVECNSANLLIHHDFEGLLIDADPMNIRYGKAYYRRHRDVRTWQPQLVDSLVTAENINNLIKQNDFQGAIDLLSIDIDGMDYWVWKAIETVSPRVVVAECNNLWEPEAVVTIPYDPNFVSDAPEYYAGASLAALNKLAREKGYRLIGANRYGFNAFFLRNDIDRAQKYFPEVTPAACQTHPYCVYARTVKKEKIAQREWTNI